MEMVYLLIVVIFWVLCTFILWKFIKLSKVVKWILTIILAVLSLSIFLFFLFFYILFKIDSSRGRVSYIPVSPKSGVLQCQTLNNQWSKCLRPDSHISFEYPASWFYTRRDTSSSEDTQFGPVNPVTGSNQAVILYVSEYKNETDAFNEVKNNFLPINGKGGETTLNGFHASLNPDGKSVIIGYKNQTYQFVLYDFHSPTNGITKDQAKSGFDHMIQSLKAEN